MEADTRTTRIVLAGALALLVAGAAAMQFWPDAVPSADVPAAAKDGDHYFCDKCNKEFIVKIEDYPNMAMDEAIVAKDLTAGRRPHCTLCGAKHTGWMMTQCPQCQKYSLPAGLGPAPAVGPGQKDLCPHCRSDRSQWYGGAGRS